MGNRKARKTDGKFQLLCGRLGDIPICMQINNEVVPDDPNNYMHILHRITFSIVADILLWKIRSAP